ncbi:MAG: hypothetical protein HC840_16875 [Leptolyngbyaceae cyanobacterium RM2_2_4]|nr:hypothetical protein [Leptolyngbyaceae cyanobacterium RM2_2_4]
MERNYKDYFSLQAPDGEYNEGKLYTTVNGTPVKAALKRVDKPNNGATIMIGFFVGNELVKEIDLLDAIKLPGLYKRKRDVVQAAADQILVNEIVNG